VTTLDDLEWWHGRITCHLGGGITWVQYLGVAEFGTPRRHEWRVGDLRIPTELIPPARRAMGSRVLVSDPTVHPDWETVIAEFPEKGMREAIPDWIVIEDPPAPSRGLISRPIRSN
jgi:hypothetical protein